MVLLVLVPLLPLLTAFIVMTGHRADQDQTAKAGLFPIVAAFVGALVTLVLVPSEGAITVQFYDPAAMANLAFPIGFYIDRLSAVMMVLISGVTALIYRYSVGYMYQDRGYRRYLGLLGITTSVLLCMVCSANLVMLFMFWQILPWLLFLAGAQPRACRDARGRLQHLYALAPRRRGLSRRDCAGLFALWHLRVSGAVRSRRGDSRDPVSLACSGWEMDGVTAVTLLIFVGAMSKSAQFPLHTWLPRSLYAPTPVHALLHAGIINAGGFLLNRLAPLYGLSPDHACTSYSSSAC